MPHGQADPTSELLASHAEFLSALSHELRMPLAAIKGFAQLLIVHWAEMPDAKRYQSVEQIIRSTARLERLVGDISLATKLVEEVPIQFEQVEIAPLIAEAIDEVRVVHGKRSFSIEAPAVAVPLWADRERVAQVLINLLDNAAKYSPAGTPIVMRWRHDDPVARFEVIDYGTGLTPDEQTQLFVRFSRLHTTRRASGLSAGSGLGLFICQRLVEAMGGAIGVQAAEDRPGNMFWFSLPCDA